MNFSQFIHFHFLRPYWLLMLIPAIVIYWLLRRRQSASRQWSSSIAPRLLKHLIVGTEQRSRVRPYQLLFPIFVLAALALAGPTWQREATPFTEDAAPLVIALDLSSSMDVTDIQPSRLQRAQQKVRDLLSERSGARTGVIVYAGSAHLVLPLTDDLQILETYVSSLNTGMMPVQGKEPAKALKLAQEMLVKEEIPGTILFMTDGINKAYMPAFAEQSRQSKDQLMALGIGTSMQGVKSPLDREGFEALSKEAKAYVTTVTVDDSDIQRINARIKNHFKAVRNEHENSRWKDFGYYLVYPVAILLLFWLRRGWTIQWAAGILLIFCLFQPSPGEAKEFRFVDLWLTADQQGRSYFEKGNYAEAAEGFENPIWKGIAYYAAEDFEAAIEQFSRLDTPTAYFN
ncbi:MAG: VWA domain-containing protein, partial [bacterium]|nr:VWA domain-containing protein [bacterium]